ncbi:MAG: HAMP domain-containing sensor histidine kinase [Bdellovibrionota bacterium]
MTTWTPNIEALILDRLECMLVKYVGPNEYHLCNEKPKWIAWIDYDRQKIEIEKPRKFDLIELFPELKSFLPYAKESWKQSPFSVIHSDPWKQKVDHIKEHIWLQATSFSIESEFFLVLQDISHSIPLMQDHEKISKGHSEDLRKIAEKAHEANETKSAFLANMSHELRTPLNSIIGFSNLLLKNKSILPDSQEFVFLEKIKSNGIHLLSLINDILDLSKIEAKKMDLHLRDTNLSDLIQETVQEMEGLRSTKNVKVEMDIPFQLLPIKTDRKKLKQVLLNLISNAYKFAENKSVTVRVDAKDHIPSRILMIDTGIGIPKEKLDEIFESFQQADTTSARKFEGTGLGLTISKSLCALLGYKITVASTVKKGSTFIIHLNA